MEPSPDWLCPPQLMLCVEGLEEEPFNYEATPETDELLLLASQAVEFDESSDIPPVVKQVEPPATTPPPEDVDRDSIDDLFIAASQQLDDYELEGVREATGSSEKQRKFGRFAAPVTATEVEMARKCGVPQKTRDQTSWSCRVWAAWTFFALLLLCIILRILLYVHCYDYHGYGYQTKFMTCETTGL